MFPFAINFPVEGISTTYVKNISYSLFGAVVWPLFNAIKILTWRKLQLDKSRSIFYFLSPLPFDTDWFGKSDAVNVVHLEHSY